MLSSDKSRPRIAVPPPVAFAVGLILGWWLSTRFPTVCLHPAFSHALGWVLIIGAGALGASCITLFLQQRTTIRPDRPARSLVTRGPYSLSRNPMYVSSTLLYTGLSVLWQWFWALLLLPLVLLYIDRHVIRQEERHLKAKFGVHYEQYVRKVRRWV